MALVTRAANPGIDVSQAMKAGDITGLLAGEDLIVGPCYVKASDNKVYNSNGTANDAAAKCHGFAARSAKAGQPVTLFGVGARFGYGSGMTPGAPLYVAATKGNLDTAPTTGGTVPVALAISATDIVVIALTA